MKRFFAVVALIVMLSITSTSPAYAATITEFLDSQDTETLIVIRDYINALIEKRQAESGGTGFVYFGDYGIKYKDAYIQKSGLTNMLVIVFDWVNNSDGGASFGTNFSFEAYQDGFGLSVGIIWSLDTQFTTKIVPGKTIEGYYIWELRNTKDPVTVIIDKFLDLSDRYPNLVFEVDPSKLVTKK